MGCVGEKGGVRAHLVKLVPLMLRPCWQPKIENRVVQRLRKCTRVTQLAGCQKQLPLSPSGKGREETHEPKTGPRQTPPPLDGPNHQ